MGWFITTLTSSEFLSAAIKRPCSRRLSVWRRDQRSISTDGFPFVGANGLQRRVKAVAYLIVRELGHCNS